VTLPKIPALPISYQDAEPLLKALKGHGISAIDMGKDWQGGLNLPYFTGPYGLANLYVNNSFSISPIWNVIARIPGSAEPERQIILGNHRDAWVYGAADPHAGTAVMMEVAFGLGRLYRLGWRPKRTIVIASWDAEEYGLVGSTEWVEEHAEDLKKHGAVYINTDVAVTGKSFKVAASPSLSHLIREVTKSVEDPETHTSVYEQWRTNPNNPWKTPHGLKFDNSSQEAYVGEFLCSISSSIASKTHY
jgi:N-acetylated-alpha-linked acidic dipeptidase